MNHNVPSKLPCTNLLRKFEGHTLHYFRIKLSAVFPSFKCYLSPVFQTVWSLLSCTFATSFPSSLFYPSLAPQARVGENPGNEVGTFVVVVVVQQCCCSAGSFPRWLPPTRYRHAKLLFWGFYWKEFSISVLQFNQQLKSVGQFLYLNTLFSDFWKL